MTTLSDNGHGGPADAVPLDTAPAVPVPPPAEPADTAVPPGPPARVDEPGGDRRDWLADLEEKARTRRPIVPPWLASPQQAKATLKWVAAHYAYVTGWQLSRSPMYAARLAFRAPRGAARIVGGMVRWTFDLEGEPVRRATVLSADPKAYLKLSRQRDARVRLRVPVAGLAAVVAMVAALWLAVAAPALARLVALAAALALFGRLGAPADRPLIDRAVVPRRVEKLTSDMVVRALGALGIAAINQAIAKDPRHGIEFVDPIHRDGPGWLANINLPHGVTATEVMERRDKLASGLRRRQGCVWPETIPGDHPGALALWVGYEDMSKARQPAWPLAKSGSVDLFRPVPFGTDQRSRFVTVTLMFVSVVIGSIPRMGKTFLLRLLGIIAALDVRAELHLYDLKGTGDLSPLAPVAHRYRAGDEPDDIAYALDDMRALREEMRRRTKVIRDLPRDICPENKVTPELASNKSLRLHPIVIEVDECQVWFEHPQHGGEFEEICTDLTKRGPALGMVQILATQRPDAKSLPTGISANAVLRMCLKVMGWRENDMVLGTGAHGRGVQATMFSFDDKGICYFSGEGDDPRIVRSVYIDAPAAEKMALRARAARQHAGTLSGHALGEEPDTGTGPRPDLLADILAVVPETEPKVWSETVVTRLAGLRPEVYGPWGGMEPDARAAQLTAALKPHGVSTGQVWGTTDDGKGANRRGITRDDITTAVTQRDGKPPTRPAA